MDTEEQFHQFKEVVREAGKIAKAYFDASDTANEQKADGSVVTEVDKKTETFLLEYIRKHFPNDAIVGEEHGAHAGDSGFVWHIDPIDGTDNFLRKIPFCAISVARLGDSPAGSFGIVYNPLTEQMFATFLETEGGVYENDHLCKLTPDPLGGRYAISIGRGREAWMKSATYALFEKLGTKYGKCGAYGSAALELAYVAANRIDAFLTYGLKSYDYAAGLFLVKAVGGAISVFEDGKWTRWERGLKELCSQHNRTIFVSHPDVHEMMLVDIGDPAGNAN